MTEDARNSYQVKNQMPESLLIAQSLLRSAVQHIRYNVHQNTEEEYEILRQMEEYLDSAEGEMISGVPVIVALAREMMIEVDKSGRAE